MSFFRSFSSSASIFDALSITKFVSRGKVMFSMVSEAIPVPIVGVKEYIVTQLIDIVLPYHIGDKFDLLEWPDKNQIAHYIIDTDSNQRKDVRYIDVYLLDSFAYASPDSLFPFTARFLNFMKLRIFIGKLPIDIIDNIWLHLVDRPRYLDHHNPIPFSSNYYQAVYRSIISRPQQPSYVVEDLLDVTVYYQQHRVLFSSNNLQTLTRYGYVEKYEETERNYVQYDYVDWDRFIYDQ